MLSDTERRIQVCTLLFFEMSENIRMDEGSIWEKVMHVKGICPKCGNDMKLTKHHILPKRHYGRKSQLLFFLCRECHNDLELIIPQTKVLSDIEYFQIIIRFLNRGKRHVRKRR